MNARRIALSIVGLLALCAAARAGPALVGATHDGILYDINPSTGVATNPRALGIGDVTGLAWSPSSQLFVRTGFHGTVPDALYTVGLDGASPTLVGSIVRDSLDFDLDVTTNLLLADQGIDGTRGSILYSVNPQTGEPTDITHAPVQGSPVAVDLTGNVYLLDVNAFGGDELLHIDRNTGNVLESWVLSTQLLGPGLAFGPTGVLYITDGAAQGPGNLYMFDRDNGMLATVGSTGLSTGVVALAYVPEPSSAALFALLGLLIVHKSSARLRTSAPATTGFAAFHP